MKNICPPLKCSEGGEFSWLVLPPPLRTLSEGVQWIFSPKKGPWAIHQLPAVSALGYIDTCNLLKGFSKIFLIQTFFLSDHFFPIHSPDQSVTKSVAKFSSFVFLFFAWNGFSQRKRAKDSLFCCWYEGRRGHYLIYIWIWSALMFYWKNGQDIIFAWFLERSLLKHWDRSCGNFEGDCSKFLWIRGYRNIDKLGFCSAN